MNVLLVALEYSSYPNERPPADAVFNLAKALRLLDHNVTVVVPKASVVEQSGLVAARRLSPLRAQVRDDQHVAGDLAHVYDATLSSGVQLSLLDMLPWQEDAVVDLAATVPESRERAVWLRRWAAAVSSYVSAQTERGSPFDVVHAHDCEAGLSLLFVQEVGIAKVLSVHDASSAGTFPRMLAPELGLSEDWLNSHGFGLREEISLLKGLLTQAGAVTVPSENYGKKLQAPEYHGALARTFQSIPLLGILQGVDYAVFNPATDPVLPVRFDAACPENKGRNRADVLRRLEIDFDPARPIVVCEHDPAGDCAWSTLTSSLPAIMRSEVTCILIGGPAPDGVLKEQFVDRLRHLPSVDAPTRRKIFAAADFYLSVRRKDPSGSGLMQAGRYGAVPIAYLVDATPDLVIDCDMELATGNGVLFDTMTQRALQTAIFHAVRAFRSPGFTRLVARVMRRDCSWERTARRYAQVYSQLLSAR